MWSFVKLSVCGCGSEGDFGYSSCVLFVSFVMVVFVVGKGSATGTSSTFERGRDSAVVFESSSYIFDANAIVRVGCTY